MTGVTGDDLPELFQQKHDDLVRELSARAIADCIVPVPLEHANRFWPASDMDALAQHEMEGRCRHRPRNVFEPNRHAQMEARP
ncbi:MAG: hypothetical protein PGN22_15660 [Agrobacterium cavarae]